MNRFHIPDGRPLVLFLGNSTRHPGNATGGVPFVTMDLPAPPAPPDAPALHILEQAQKCAGRGGGGREDVESERTLLAATGTSVLLRKLSTGGGRRSDADTLLGPITKQVRLRPVHNFGLLSCLSQITITPRSSHFLSLQSSLEQENQWLSIKLV